MLNVDVRDNLLVLSTHAHSGAAGMGASSMSGLSLAALGTLTFADQSANPDAAGELQRNGNDILWYGSSVVNLTQADASAGTASLRSLGTTAVKAAAGNHTHIPGTPNQLILDYGGLFLNTDSESVVRTGTIAVQGASEALAVFGAVQMPDGSGNAYTVRLKYTVAAATTTIDTVTGLSTHTSIVQELPESGTAGLISPTSVATYTIFITVERTTGSSAFNPRAIIYAREVGA
tara:strand:- start:248 stop:946 length:699 start_codon:yes stop_codon:yes gene_type:complete